MFDGIYFWTKNYLLFFQVSRRQSFERIENWIVESEKCEIPVRILVGNKAKLIFVYYNLQVDLYTNTKGAVTKSEAIGLAKKYGMEYFETWLFGIIYFFFNFKYLIFLLFSSIGDTSISLVYDYLFTTILNSIPNPPTPQSLVGKGILLGKRLLNSSKY